MIVINADDYGYDSETNCAVVNSLGKGYCCSTSVMSNMPGFEEASELAHEHRFINHVGIHFVLTEGIPLTDGIKKCSRFCNSDGEFVMSRNRRYLKLNAMEKKSVADELRAQVKKCRRKGISISHADSHQHAHEEWAIASLIIGICQHEGIPYLRLARNCGQVRPFLKRLYRDILNIRIRKSGMARTDYFGSLTDYVYLLDRNKIDIEAVSMEVMLHPFYSSDGSLVDKIDGINLDDILGQIS